MKKAALIALIGMVALTPAAGEASKGKTDKSCPDDAICVWTKSAYRGERVVVQGNGVSNKIGNKINNEASSIKNRFDQTIFIYDKRDATGELRCLGSLDRVRNLGASYGFDNRVASSDVPNDPGVCI
ncbi:MAG: Peptidase inhibitor family [Solirubrobacterales bacterium]|jgi:hypothetical protein|nr:Peptidase inhibitor family [Solirubrobacterales bacterium]